MATPVQQRRQKENRCWAVHWMLPLDICINNNARMKRKQFLIHRKYGFFFSKKLLSSWISLSHAFGWKHHTSVKFFSIYFDLTQIITVPSITFVLSHQFFNVFDRRRAGRISNWIRFSRLLVILRFAAEWFYPGGSLLWHVFGRIGGLSLVYENVCACGEWMGVGGRLKSFSC